MLVRPSGLRYYLAIIGLQLTKNQLNAVMLLELLQDQAVLTGTSQRVPAKSATKVTFAQATEPKASTNVLQATMAPLLDSRRAYLVLQATSAQPVRKIQQHASALRVISSSATNIPPLAIFVQLATVALASRACLYFALQELIQQKNTVLAHLATQQALLAPT